MFIEYLHLSLSPHDEARDFVELAVEDTPEYDPLRMNQRKLKHVPFGMKIKSNFRVGDQYLKADIIFPRGDKIARGHIVHLKCDADGNPMSRSNQNYILVTHLYEVEFSRGGND